VHVPAGRTAAVAAHDARVQFGGARIVRSDGRGPHDAVSRGHATLFVVLVLLVLVLVLMLVLMLVLVLVQLERRLLLEHLFHGRRGGRAEQVGEVSDTVETHCVPARSHSETMDATGRADGGRCGSSHAVRGRLFR